MPSDGTGGERAPRVGRLGRWPRIAAGLVALASSASIASDGRGPWPRAGAAEAGETAADSPAGSCGRQGSFRICVLEVRDRKRIDDPLTGVGWAPRGRAFKLVRLRVSNDGPNERLVLAHSDFKLVDREGSRYAPDTSGLYFACADAGYRMFPLAESVNPRSAVEGWLVFEVPVDVGEGVDLEAHISFLGTPVRLSLRVAEAKR